MMAGLITITVYLLPEVKKKICSLILTLLVMASLYGVRIEPF